MYSIYNIILYTWISNPLERKYCKTNGITSEKASSSIVDIEFSEKSRYLIPRTCMKAWLLMAFRLLFTIRSSLISIPYSIKLSGDNVDSGIREIERNRIFLICRRSWSDTTLFSFPLRSRLYKEYWKPLNTSANNKYRIDIYKYTRIKINVSFKNDEASRRALGTFWK